MKLATTLRINMTGAPASPETQGERYRAAIEMAAYADRHGFSIVNVEEHHCAAIGWLPSPLVMAGLIAGRTARVRIRVSALLITLYDPIRLAEDIAMDRDWASRGMSSDFILQTLLQAWRGEAFEYRGRMVRISPVPQTRPIPPLAYGGMSAAAARRAARFGLDFHPPAHMPELVAIYEDELERLGKCGHAEWPREGTSLVFLDEDPEAAWQEIGPYLLAEAAEYGSWAREGVERPFASADLTLD